MNEKDLYKIIGEISDDLILEAYDSSVKVRRIRVWKIAAAAAVLVVIFGVSVWAVSGFMRGSIAISDGTPDYVSVPSQETLHHDIGITPKIIEKFSNGYSFKDASIANSEDVDENGNSINFYKELSCDYYNGKNKISLHVFPASSSEISENMEVIDVFNGSEINYKSYTAKIVPNGYGLSEQDKMDEMSGKYVFSYGSENIEILRIQCIRWECGGIDYMLMEMNGDDKISKEELAGMAQEMISFQEVEGD